MSSICQVSLVFACHALLAAGAAGYSHEQTSSSTAQTESEISAAGECESRHMKTSLLQRVRPHGEEATSYTSLKPNSSALIWHGTPRPGQMVKGTLTVKMDPSDEDSPELKIPVQMLFAAEQPAINGPLLVHCGGPGSGIDCVEYFGKMDQFNGYDVWAISQRGMGPDANPVLTCNHSKLPAQCPDGGCKISDFTDCPCALLDGTPQIGEIWTDIDPTNESQVHNLMSLMKDWSIKRPGCYMSERFLFNGKNGRQFNLLDYVGTQFLAYDIDLFRSAIGAPKMSIYGWSYGTFVGGVYATVFPQNTHRLVLDGNMAPMPQKNAQGLGDARANDKAIAKLLLDCQLAPDNCSLKDPEAQYAQVVAAARAGVLTAPTKTGKQFPLSVGMLMGYLQVEYTSNSGAGFPVATQMLSFLASDNVSLREETVAKILNGYCVVKSVATWYNYDICVGPGQTLEDEGADYAETYIDQCAVWGVDQAGLSRVEDVMHRWEATKLEYSDAGLAAMLGDAAGYYFWPAIPTPVSVIGNPTLKALIIGNIYDTATSYYWSQQMHSRFPAGAMLTWQGVGHTLPFPPSPTSRRRTYDVGAVTKCRQHVNTYLQSGTLPLDGFVCKQDVPVPVG